MARSLAITQLYGSLTLDQCAETPDHPRETFTIRSFEVTEDGEETTFVFRVVGHSGRESTVIATLPVLVRIRAPER